MKVWNYLAIMITMMTFLYFLGMGPAGAESGLSSAGIQINQTTGELIESDVSNSTWWTDLFGVTGLLVAVLTGGAVIVGFFTKQFDWKLVLIPFFTGTIIKFVSFGKAIVDMAIDTGENWLIGIVATIFLPLIVMFVFSVIEWFGGSPSD